MPDGEGLSFGDSFALPRRSAVGPIPDAGRSQGIAKGSEGRQEPSEAAFVGLAYPSPRRGL